jgi:hypothetical protein
MVEIVNDVPAELENASDSDKVSQGHHTLSHTDSALVESERTSDSSFRNTKDDSNSDSNAQDSDHDQNDPNVHVGPRCTKKWIDELFKKEWKLYYRTYELNEKLYFHYKGFEKLENMHLFPELKCLYFEGNGLKKIEGLETNTQLVSLYL